MLRTRGQTMAIVVGFGLVACLSNGATKAATPIQRSHYRTPDTIVPDDLPPIGYRYDGLNGLEHRSLRQSFKLPMEALAVAESTGDLLAAAVVQPVPNPDRPFLPISAATDTAGDPFAGENNPSARDGLGALGRLFAKEAALLRAVPSASSSASSTTNSAARNETPLVSEDPFADNLAPVDREPQAEEADPFGSGEGDDFDEDPFGGF